MEGDKVKYDVVATLVNGWAPLAPSTNPKDFWGSNDKDPPLADISLAA